MRARRWLAVVALLAAGCGGPATSAQAPTRTSLAAGPRSPRQCPQSYGSPGPALRPARGRAGTVASVSAAFGHYGEDGRPASPTRSVQVWWNLSSRRWWSALEPRPVPDRRGPVLELVRASVPRRNPCGFRLRFRVPKVAPGSYAVEVLYLTARRRSAASSTPVRFRVLRG